MPRNEGAICGGPEPGKMKACYGGCYGWCIHPFCSKQPNKLTDKERLSIRQFQTKCGGSYPNDLRQPQDFRISPTMLATLKLCAPTSGSAKMIELPRSSAAPLLRRNLIWELDGLYHTSGAGASLLRKLRRATRVRAK